MLYPSVTEDVCVPILEEESGLKCCVDFKVGIHIAFMNELAMALDRIEIDTNKECLDQFSKRGMNYV